MSTITTYPAAVTNGEPPALDERAAIKVARWQQALEKATTPERQAAVQLEIDKLMGLAGLATVEERRALLQAELAKLEG